LLRVCIHIQAQSCEKLFQPVSILFIRGNQCRWFGEAQ